MTTQLEYRTNNGTDHVILVDKQTWMVLSDWPVDPTVLKDFCDCSQDAGDWDNRHGCDDMADEYGEIVAIREGYELTAIDRELWNERVAFVLH